MTTLSLLTDRSLIRARGASVRYVLASIAVSPARNRDGRLPVNVAFVLDRSGSMDGENKLELAKQAIISAIRLLGPNDRFSIVTFDTEVDVLLPAARATAEAKNAAGRALRGVQSRSSTDLCAGWMRGCEQLAEYLADGMISRALLLTDGQANHGETNHATLVHHAGDCAGAASQPPRSELVPTSTSTCCETSRTTEAGTSTSSRAPRRFRISSRANWARRSTSWCRRRSSRSRSRVGCRRTS